MTIVQVMWALTCVGMISMGQLLFKRAGIEIQQANTWFTWRVVFIVGGAGIIYAIATLLWISLLRQVALNRAYLFMALSFAIVPVASHFLFREPLSLGFIFGAGLIFAGLLVATYSI